MRALRIELRRGPGRWMFPLLVAVGVFAGSQQTLTAAVWTYATQAAAGSIRLAGPLAAGVAAWAGLRSRRRRTFAVESGAARPPAALPAVECAAIVVWTLAALALPTALLFGYTALHAT